MILFQLSEDGGDNCLPYEFGLGRNLVFFAIHLQSLHLLVIKEDCFAMDSKSSIPFEHILCRFAIWVAPLQFSLSNTVCNL